MKTDQPQQFYHGGLVGRRVGDLILPSAITKARHRWHRNAQRVFVSTTYWKSVCYAVGRPMTLNSEELGKVYRVQPFGTLTLDPAEVESLQSIRVDDPDYSIDAYYCESARVLEVISPSVEDVMKVPGEWLADFIGNPTWTTSCRGDYYLLALLIRYALAANEPPSKAVALFTAASRQRGMNSA
jgi:hypothetical protein